MISTEVIDPSRNGTCIRWPTRCTLSTSTVIGFRVCVCLGAAMGGGITMRMGNDGNKNLDGYDADRFFRPCTDFVYRFFCRHGKYLWKCPVPVTKFEAILSGLFFLVGSKSHVSGESSLRNVNSRPIDKDIYIFIFINMCECIVV